MPSPLKRTYHYLKDAANIAKLSIAAEAPALLCFMFHSLFRDESEIAQNLVDPLQRTNVAQFRRFVAYFIRHGYRFISPDELLAGVPAGGKYAMLTFDDGYFNNTLALPILHEFSAPAVFFIPTENIVRGKSYWWDVLYRERTSRGVEISTIAAEARSVKSLTTEAIEEKLLSEFGRAAFTPRGEIDRPFTVGELRSFSADPLVHLGNHTFNHAILTNYSAEQARDQIGGASAELKEIIGREPTCFAYPNGNYSDSVVDVCREMGMKLAFTVVPRKTTMPLADPLRIGRFAAFGDRPLIPQCRAFRASLKTG